MLTDNCDMYVYQIKNRATRNVAYVGISSQPYVRMASHKRRYPSDKYSFAVIGRCKYRNAAKVERRFIVKAIRMGHKLDNKIVRPVVKSGNMLSIPVHPEIKQQLRLVAQALGVSISDIVRDLIRTKIKATKGTR